MNTNLSPRRTKRCGRGGKVFEYDVRTEEQRVFIATSIGKLMTTHEIENEYMRLYGVPLKAGHSIVNQFKRLPKWRDLIATTRAAWVAGIEEEAGYHKRKRIERMDKVVEKAFEKNDLKAAIQATEEQRKEVDGGGESKVSFNQFNFYTDIELEMQRKEALEKIKLLEFKHTKGVIDVSTNQNETVGA